MPGFDVFSRLVGGSATAIGLAAAIWYSRSGLSLSHYDAKAHLVVARRILDSITPGWEQIGAVWLPLPHLLNALPVQMDALYRNGASATLLSVLALGIGAGSVAAMLLRLTGSRPGALTGAALLVANPNVLYLHATPMTEPLLFGTTLYCAWRMTDWATSEPLAFPRRTGWWLVAACLTRYEAWPIAGALIGTALVARWRRGASIRELIPVAWAMAAYPIGTAIAFACFSRVTVGAWFVSSGFFVPDETLLGRPAVVLEQMMEGVGDLGGAWLIRLSAASVAAILLAAVWWRQGAALLVPLSLFAAAALPVSAYLSGHPFRIRYQIPLVVAAAVAVGLGVGLTRRLAPAAAAIAIALVVWNVPPLDSSAPILAEAQVDTVHSEGRRAVTACLARDYRGETIFASMGSLAHYMQELSHIGLGIADFLHEGNHPVWDVAVVHGGSAFAGWMLVEEVAEGGDVLAHLIRDNPLMLDGYERVCEGGNVALYRRASRPGASPASPAR